MWRFACLARHRSTGVSSVRWTLLGPIAASESDRVGGISVSVAAATARVAAQGAYRTAAGSCSALARTSKPAMGSLAQNGSGYRSRIYRPRP